MEKRQIEVCAMLSNFSVINSELTRARCRVFSTGRNRNNSDITKNALNKLIARKGYANKPVVAHLYKGTDGKWRVGGHDTKWVIDSSGKQEIIDETIPFGVIPEKCNPTVEDVVENSGEVRQYFCVDIILWTHRYNILDAVKSDEIWFNQSMEITFDKCHYDKDGYCVIDDFDLSALCLLNHDVHNKNNEVYPCFPSAVVTKFSLDGMKGEFDIMFNKLKELEKQKGENGLDISMIKEKLDSKFFAVSVNPDSVIAIDKSNFEIYEIPYAINTENSDIVFDMDKAVKKYAVLTDNDSGISFSAVGEYVNSLTADITAAAEKNAAEKFNSEKAEVIKDLTDKLDGVSSQYEAAKCELREAQEKLASYLAAEQKAAEDKHRAEIDAVIDKYSAKLYNNADYLMYKTKIDYSKAPEEIDRDMLCILGKANMSSGKQTFSSATWGVSGDFAQSNVAGGRYGDLFDKIAN